MKGKLLFILTLFTGLMANAQVDPYELSNSLLDHVRLIKNYSAEVNISIDVDILNIEDRKAQIYFEKPNKLDIQSDGFTLMPKNGLMINNLQMLEEEYSAIYIGEDTLHQKDAHMIKVIPLSDTSEIILAQLWVDHDKKTVHRIQSFTKENGTFTMDLFYKDHPYMLPDKIRVEFVIQGNMLPTSAATDISYLSEGLTKGEDSPGVVWLQFSNYKVNISN